jgi:hypothetical protein
MISWLGLPTVFYMWCHMISVLLTAMVMACTVVRKAGSVATRTSLTGTQPHLPLLPCMPPLPAQHPTKLGKNIEKVSYEPAPANQEHCCTPCPSISLQEA